MNVLISIRPQHIQNICEVIGESNGKPLYKKTTEVRKSRPKLETPFKCLIYCTNDKRQYLRKLGTSCREIFITESKDILGRTDKVKSIIGDTTTFWEKGGYNGKVIGEFICDEIEPITEYELLYDGHYFEEKTCVSQEELLKYKGKNNFLYGWHITDLKIYDKPKELSEFEQECKHAKGFPKSCKNIDCECYYEEWQNCYAECVENGMRRLTRPPQSWCYVES